MHDLVGSLFRDERERLRRCWKRGLMRYVLDAGLVGIGLMNRDQ